MEWLWWSLVGAAVVVGLLLLGLRVNRKKRTARLAVRLAEVYRAWGYDEVARRLYQVPLELDQNREQAQQGLVRLEAGNQEPVLEEGLFAQAEALLQEGRERIQRVLNDRGLTIELPPLDEDGDADARKGTQRPDG